MAEGLSKIRVTGRDDPDAALQMNVRSLGYAIEAEYRTNSESDRDAVLAFVERVVRVMQRREEISE